jgi:hypothetical protein
MSVENEWDSSSSFRSEAGAISVESRKYPCDEYGYFLCIKGVKGVKSVKGWGAEIRLRFPIKSGMTNRTITGWKPVPQKNHNRDGCATFLECLCDSCGHFLLWQECAKSLKGGKSVNVDGVDIMDTHGHSRTYTDGHETGYRNRV